MGWEGCPAFGEVEPLPTCLVRPSDHGCHSPPTVPGSPLPRWAGGPGKLVLHSVETAHETPLTGETRASSHNFVRIFWQLQLLM